MAGPHPVYRSLVRLYPSSFRRDYGDDLLALHAELVADRGPRVAWARTALDLAITIPRYHLEHIMTEQHSTTALTVAVAVLAVAGLGVLTIGFFPGPVVLLLVAAVVGITQRTTLARALRVPTSNMRGRRLRTAATLGLVFVASLIVFLMVAGDSWTPRETVLYVVGNLAMFGAIGFLVAGLLTRRDPADTTGTGITHSPRPAR